jgi:hypothetical protein
MHYELWHMPTGNLVNTFEREADALVAVRRAYEQSGREAGESFALGTEDRRGRSRQLATGSDLLARALGGESAHGATLT